MMRSERRNHVYATKRHAAASIGLMALTFMPACRHGYGLERRAMIAMLPPRECVARALGKVARIEQVQDVEWRWNQADERCPGRTVPLADDSYVYAYQGNAVLGTLEVVSCSPTQVVVEQGLRVNFLPPPNLVKNTRAAMHEVEEALETTCGISTLRTNVRESCLNIPCRE